MARHQTINEMIKEYEAMDKKEFNRKMSDSLTPHGQQLYEELLKKEDQEQQLYDQLNKFSRESCMLFERDDTPQEELRAYHEKRMFYLGKIKLIQKQCRAIQNQLPSCIKFDFDIPEPSNSEPIVID